ncbi:hypothetical protein MBLNU13_g04111t1 [Cladosporium sp. NU13]
MSSDDINAVSPDKHNTTSSENIIATSTENINTAFTDDVDNFPSNNIVATSSSTIAATSHDNMIAISSNDITSTHVSTATTSNKRKQASSDPQEETQDIPKKKARTLTDFEYIRDTFGYSFKNLRLLNEALNTTPALRAQSNQSLALIGDSILQLTIYRDWYPSRQLKGTGNQLVQTIGCNANLAKVALRIGLDQYIVTAQGIIPPQSLLATTMEAVLGAIDCDSGEDANAVRRAMRMVGLTPGATS